MCVCVCVCTSDREVSSAVGFAQVVFSKTGVFAFICPADVVEPQDSIWSYCDSEKTQVCSGPWAPVAGWLQYCYQLNVCMGMDKIQLLDTAMQYNVTNYSYVFVLVLYWTVLYCVVLVFLLLCTSALTLYILLLFNTSYIKISLLLMVSV